MNRLISPQVLTSDTSIGTMQPPQQRSTTAPYRRLAGPGEAAVVGSAAVVLGPTMGVDTRSTAMGALQALITPHGFVGRRYI